MAPAYRFPDQLKEGTIVARPNRFIMMVDTGGATVRAHCPTTGRIGELVLPGLPCLYSTARGGARKTGYTVEAVAPARGTRDWIGINQTAANRYLEFFFREGALRRLASGEVRREVRLGRSRLDFVVGGAYVEVKTPLMMLPSDPEGPMARHSRFDSFDRLIKHMDELRRSLKTGGRAAIVLCYLYDAKPFTPPAPDGTNLKILGAARAAERAGVERWQINLRIDPEGVSLIRYFRSRPYAGPAGRTARPGP